MPIRNANDSDFDQTPPTREQTLLNQLITTLGAVQHATRLVLNSLDPQRDESKPYAKTGGELRGAFETMRDRVRAAETLAELIIAERKANRTKG